MRKKEERERKKEEKGRERERGKEGGGNEGSYLKIGRQNII